MQGSHSGLSMRQSTAARHQNLHDRLLVAAETAIEQSGLQTLRARALADAVGCSVGAIYGPFPDLDALILAVNARTLEAIDAALRVVPPGEPAERLVHLAMAYLDYAAAHRQRWDALFEHRLPDGRPLTPWYADRLALMFHHIEGPLADLQPGLAGDQLARLARTLFSAVHGVVQLGLDEKITPMPPAMLREQLRIIVGAMASGLAPGHAAARSSRAKRPAVT